MIRNESSIGSFHQISDFSACGITLEDPASITDDDEDSSDTDSTNSTAGEGSGEDTTGEDTTGEESISRSKLAPNKG